MAKKKKEKVVEETPKVNEPKGDVTKVQEKMKKPSEILGETITKVDLSKKPEEKTNETKEEVVENNVDDGRVVEIVEDAGTTQEQKEVQPEVETQETPVVEEITTEEVKEQVEDLAIETEEAITESMQTGKPLPENVEKLLNFMEETGGDLQDYVKLNQDYSDMDNQTLLQEYYRQTKPHLTQDEIDFVMEDQFSYDEELEENVDIKRKKLAMKEQVASAKQHLESVKSKYYEDIKMGSKLTKEQQDAVNFFKNYNEESDRNQEMSKIFRSKTDNVFNNKFKGFEYNVGDKKFRFNVKDLDAVKTKQTDINNFIGKFLNEDNTMEDAAGYHKGLFTAMNPDQIANHIYEQGKTDALKESIAKSKNVSMDPRETHVDNVNTSGFKARALNNDGPGYKFQIKNKK